MSGSIVVDRESILGRSQDSGEFWLELRTESDDFRAFSTALREVNDRFAQNAGPFTQLGTRSPDGFVTLVDDVAGDEQLDEWLNALAERLEHNGFEGTIRGVVSERPPAWYDVSGVQDRTRVPYPPEHTAFIAWTVDRQRFAAYPRRWSVAADATDRICRHVAAWSQPGGPMIVVTRGSFRFSTEDGAIVAPVLADAIRTSSAGVLRFRPDRAEGRAAALWPRGETTLQSIGADQPWQRRIDALRDAVMALPELTAEAFVRPARRCPKRWASFLASSQPLPHQLSDDIFRDDDYFLDAHVPDAHGIQVLRDEHLAKAHDLSAWNITPLEAGRHLVEAPDLAPWYSTPLPDPEVVERARRDFGGMILTQAIIDDIRSA